MSKLWVCILWEVFLPNLSSSQRESQKSNHVMLILFEGTLLHSNSSKGISDRWGRVLSSDGQLINWVKDAAKLQKYGRTLVQCNRALLFLLWVSLCHQFCAFPLSKSNEQGKFLFSQVGRSFLADANERMHVLMYIITYHCMEISKTHHKQLSQQSFIKPSKSCVIWCMR